MTGNFIKPPSMGEGSGSVQMPLIYEATGLPARYMTESFITENVIPCVATTFSDGEVVLPHSSPPEDPVVREHFGTADYAQGTFGPRLRELLEGSDVALQHQVDGLIRFSAGIFARHVVSGVVTLPPQKIVEIMPALIDPAERHDLFITSTLLGAASIRGWDMTRPSIGFDHRAVALDAEPAVVIDYGPGLQGRHHIERQLAAWQSGQGPYTYLAVGKGPFINEFLQQYWAARLGDDPRRVRSVLGRLYIGREDGMAAATTEFVESQRQHTGSSEIADIVVASGVHKAGYDEVGTGLANAHKLLRPGGILLVRAPKAINSEPGSVPAEAMVDMALQAGFSRDQAQFFDTVTRPEVGPQEVQALSAVFKK